MTDQTPIIPAIRHDGWTPARRTQFLDHLAHDGSVCTACSRVGMSREAAYRLRRRDALFAHGRDIALVLARQVSAEVLANRALDGVEEDVWYRGELVGTRRKYDIRLLLAHMARLDKLAENLGEDHDLDRFDEVLALVGGETPPEELVAECDELPFSRDIATAIAVDMAEDDWREEAALLAPVHDESSDEARARLEVMRWQVSNEAVAVAGARWDGWFAQACAAVDRLLGEPVVMDPATGRTVSELSTSSGEAVAEAGLEAEAGSARANVGRLSCRPRSATAGLTGRAAFRPSR